MASGSFSAGTAPSSKSLAKRSPAAIASSKRALWRELERVTQDRRGPADLAGQRPVRRNPAARDPLERLDAFRPDPRISSPRELAFAGELERVGEIVERSAELFDRQQEFFGRDATLAGLDRRDGLAVLEAEHARELVLGELALLPQRLDARSDQVRSHPVTPNTPRISLRIARCKIILRSIDWFDKPTRPIHRAVTRYQKGRSRHRHRRAKEARHPLNSTEWAIRRLTAETSNFHSK